MAITSSLLGILRTGRVLRSSSFPTNPSLIRKLNTPWTSSPSGKKMSSWAERLFRAQIRFRILPSQKNQDSVSRLLRHVMEMQTSFGRTLSRAVIRVPSYFNYTQRQATKDAATKAGLEIGNFDLCIKEQATSRGSEDNLLEFIVRELKKTHGFDVREDPLILKRLEEAIEKASISKADIKLNIPSIQGKAERLMTIKWA
ncbi:hypothetical protein C5167_010730 [Papaver somniferum]|uniref:Uncharacterized protein n=1 Tax=Papaver somniferum TaxID=3469 RepID=A0A4Y7K3X8_PAPSO|nr:hypothetical protein C5167_010730 [Papaver somniferum]